MGPFWPMPEDGPTAAARMARVAAAPHPFGQTRGVIGKIVTKPSIMGHMERSRATGAQPTSARRLLRPASALVLFLGFGYLGRLSVIDREALSMVWPAAGVAALWLASGNRRTWPGDAAALAAATLTVNLTTGASVGASLAFVVSNLLQVIAFVVLVRRWLSGLWGFGGANPLHRLADLGRLVVASLTSSLVGSATGFVALRLVGEAPESAHFLVWWGRNTISILVLTLAGLLAGPHLSSARTPRDLGRLVLDAVRPRSRSVFLEALLLAATSLALYGVLFGRNDGASLSFLVLAVSVWAGLRFSPLAVMIHGIAVGTVGLVFTLHGQRPVRRHRLRLRARAGRAALRRHRGAHRPEPVLQQDRARPGRRPPRAARVARPTSAPGCSTRSWSR